MLIRRRARLHADGGDRGSALVEFGVILPFFLAILVGLVTASLFLFTRLQLATAAQEGARVMTVGGDKATAVAAVQAAAAADAVDVALPVGVKCSDGTMNKGAMVTVLVTRKDVVINWLVGSGTWDIKVKAVTQCP